MSLVSSTSSRSSKYDVFLSFRGQDTRKTFTAHLLKELKGKNIETYMDDDKLKKGDEISPELLRAIQKSKISVVIFSKSYASSRWCLDELVQILKCKDRNRQIVVPVFYHVEPSHVRNLKGTYGTDFAALEKRYKFRMDDRVKAWRDALKKAANLAGFNSKDSRDKADLVDKVARDLWNKLKQISSGDIDNDLVGIEERIKQIKTLLSRGSQDINIIGIWGMGGVGKTTLASTIFKCLRVEFEASCFLENVREKLEKGGIEDLRETLYRDLLKEDNLSISSSSIRSNFYRDRLDDMKVFIVLDDVTEARQVDNLVGDHMKRFGKGSVVIVTSRDLQVLINATTKEYIYEVVALNDDEALRLFQMNAFKRNPSSSKDYTEISRKVIHYAGGIPLALKVLGCMLLEKSKDNWESALDKLKRIPEQQIQRVLQISYNNLDREHKEIFLDIACFFKGWDKDRVQDILDGCGFSTLDGISNLIDKSLLTINGCNQLEMHDLIQDMGREVDRGESKHLECSRRLWNDKEVWPILQRSTATKKVEGIFFDIGYLNNGCHTCQRRCVNSESFSQMSNLRLLQIYNSRYCKCELYLSNGLQSLPSAPCFFHWEEYPSKSLPSNFIVENLVELHFPFSNIERLWDGVKHLPNLKKIVGKGSLNLIEIPNLSQAPNLQIIDFQDCMLATLSEVPINIEKLVLACTAIHELPSTIEHAKKLKILNLSHCENLKNLSKLPKNLKKLNLAGTSIKKLPTTIEELSILEELDLGSCRLKCLPAGIFKLKSLIKLDLWGSGIEDLPNDIYNLNNLQVLILSWCSKLKKLPLLPVNLIKLNVGYCGRLESLPELPLNNLQVLSLSFCSKLKKLPLLPVNLIELDVNGCERLESLPELPFFLQRLYACDCISLAVLPLRTLDLQDWSDQFKVKFKEKRGVGRIQEKFVFYNCPKLGENAPNDIIAKSLGRCALVEAILLRDFAFCSDFSRILCLPGSEIPQGFDYQTEGSSINVEFALFQDKGSLLGFIIGVVVDFEECYPCDGFLTFNCYSHFKHNTYGSSPEIKYEFRIPASWSIKRPIVNSVHILIWNYLGFHLGWYFSFSNLSEATFNVVPSQSYGQSYKCCNVKKLGILLLYADLAKQLSFAEMWR